MFPYFPLLYLQKQKERSDFCYFNQKQAYKKLHKAAFISLFLLIDFTKKADTYPLKSHITRLLKVLFNYLFKSFIRNLMDAVISVLLFRYLFYHIMTFIRFQHKS
ncbi:hypothetical protein D920_02363 [Enterococcus faecalis 13-SD-W-01]|nr:hypothetical protein D920_02363 [Enterococcus faecalis 13-SD-W-01]